MNTVALDIAAESKARVPIYLYATVLSSLFIMIGLIWDISWHMSIGRDGLFSAPHLAIYLGGITAGLFSGYRVLQLTFAGSAYEKSKSVRFWGIFHGSLGNLFCIWGAIAMLTSAPFDDWWHNTYGLDVTILSPPHTVLLLGMIMIQLGAIVSVLAYQNLGYSVMDVATRKIFNTLLTLSCGFILCMVFTTASEFLGRHEMHGVLFYQVAALLFPLLLVSFSVAAKTRWGATQAALIYSVFMVLMVWILPLFPATPRLGPVLNPITRFQAFDFPLLLIAPAIVIDLITQRTSTMNKWLPSILYALSFVTVFLLVQYPFANLLMASKGHWLLGTSTWYFGSNPDWQYRYAFAPWDVNSAAEWAIGFPIALVIGFFSSRVGAAWGNWMKSIVR